ncbi:PP2C family protein-serine/threonine phosphatase [Massilia endophytica]|uniref:PP2C family protein-serine/threonine phosphatase n=1 Tax=Massilia endophytica TaxID=2899220 RepID=UPI001E348EB9|nr:protein phosphatase 2C domain-containing protein [Massilia endophytica]UGQ48406.1 protein phosphatase 2C domain-containing protein [Massilia endophytica]
MSAWQQLSPSEYLRLPLGTAFGLTDTGTVRPSNQDNFLVAQDLNLAAVADGMGGHQAGDVASAEALRLVADYLRLHRLQPDPDATWTGPCAAARELLAAAIAHANDTIYGINAAGGRSDGTGMGTTLTGIWQPAPEAPLLAFHIGDTRLYRWRNGQLAQLTRDQTMYQQALDLGAPEPLPPRNLLLQAVGPSPGIEPELHASPVQAGDLYLLCSDGLHGPTSDAAIAAVLAAARPETLHIACAELVAQAKRDGSRDNITAVLLYCPA